MKKVYVHIVLILSVVRTEAQEAFRNNGNLELHTGASVSGLGNFTNSSSAVLINNGSLYIAGNLTNDQSAMTVGTGILTLNGGAAQIVTGSQLFRTYNFVSNNTAGITLNNNLSVSGLHTFTAGLVISSATPNYLIYEAGASYTGSSDTRHVNGWVKKTGDTDFIFPVGNGVYLRPAGVENLSATSEINCHYNSPTPNLTNLALPIRVVKANEYWQINRVSGGAARIRLNWDHSKVPMDNVLLTDITVAHFTSGNWNDMGGTATGNVATTGNILSNSTNSFGAFTLGYKFFPVPLKLLSFTGERKSGASWLNWKTENEQLVDGFDIQRSNDGSQFTTIGTVAARNLSTIQEYNFQDHSSLDGIVYYRLRTVDLDGKSEYSRIVVLSDRHFLTQTFIVLNPARQGITILNKTGKSGSFDYRLYTTGGQLILKGNVNLEVNGGTVLSLPGHIINGIYILELSDKLIQFRQKILVEK